MTQTRSHTIIALLLALVMAFGALSLAGCGGGSSSSEQDNCYGEDMPVINEQ